MTPHITHFRDAAECTPIRWVLSLGVMLYGTMLAQGVTDEKRSGATAVKTEPAAPGAKPPLGQITVLVPKKELKPEGPNQALRITFDDLDLELVLNTRALSVDLPKYMPEWQKKLDGQRIRIQGYMHPGSAFQEDGLKDFVLCRDTPINFQAPQRMDRMFRATLKAGTTTRYVDNKAFDVEGIFRIKPVLDKESGELDQFYQLDDAQIVPRIIKKVQ